MSCHTAHCIALRCAEPVVGLHFGEAPSGQTRLFSLGADQRLLEYDLSSCTAANTGLQALAIIDIVTPGGAGRPCAMCFAPPMPYYSHSSMDTLLLVAGDIRHHAHAGTWPLAVHAELITPSAHVLCVCCSVQCLTKLSKNISKGSFVIAVLLRWTTCVPCTTVVQGRASLFIA